MLPLCIVGQNSVVLEHGTYSVPWYTITTTNNNELHLYRAFLGTQSALHCDGDLLTNYLNGHSNILNVSLLITCVGK